jgi:hypothetical protein
MLVGINSLLVVLLGVMHVVDMFTTMYIVYGGYGREVNPFMALAFEYGPWAFISAKLLMTFVSISIFWILRYQRWMIFVYGAVGYFMLSELIYHFDIISKAL